jgi:hypothetical protein
MHCSAGGSIFSSIFRLWETLARTKLHKLSEGAPYTRGTITVADYTTEPWCTAATTPPAFNPDGVTDTPNALNYWEGVALCFRLFETDPWECPTIRVFGISNNYMLQTLDSTKISCTVNP